MNEQVTKLTSFEKPTGEEDQLVTMLTKNLNNIPFNNLKPVDVLSSWMYVESHTFVEENNYFVNVKPNMSIISRLGKWFKADIEVRFTIVAHMQHAYSFVIAMEPVFDSLLTINNLTISSKYMMTDILYSKYITSMDLRDFTFELPWPFEYEAQADDLSNLWLIKIEPSTLIYATNAPPGITFNTYYRFKNLQYDRFANPDYI